MTLQEDDEPRLYIKCEQVAKDITIVNYNSPD